MIDDFKKRLKEIADKVSNSQSAQSITTTQTPKINTSISTNTKTTNKSGNKKATVTKGPKRQPFSWADDDPLDGWDDRSFLEGFYDIGGAVTESEREERMLQVDKALKDIEKRKRKTEKPRGDKHRGCGKRCRKGY